MPELLGKTFSCYLEMKTASFTIVRQNSSLEETAFFFFNQQDSSLESQGITCKYFISKWTDLPAFNDSFSGKNGTTTDMLNLAIKRCHSHNNPSVTTFLRGKNKHTEENAWVLARYQYLTSKLYFCTLVTMQWV